jgi:hypothetical protein
VESYRTTDAYRRSVVPMRIPDAYTEPRHDMTVERRHPAALLLGMLLALALQGCEFTNDKFCCVTPSVCAEYGAPSPTPCPSGFVCDEQGVNGSRRACVAEGSGCTGSAECTDPARPSCVGGTCTAACSGDDDCTRFPDTPLCDTSGQCVACTSDLGCPSPEAAVCAADTHTCQGCTLEEQCGRFPAMNHCDTSSGHCVECRADAADCTVATAPVCDRGTCRACRRNEECPSGVCNDATGVCRDAGMTLYVATNGTDNPDCEQQSPCKTLKHALTVAQDPLKPELIKMLSGSYVENAGAASPVVIEGARAVTIVGNGASFSRPTSDDAHVLEIRGTGTRVTIDGLRIHGGRNSGGHGLVCNTGATVIFRRVAIEANGGRGVQATDCRLTVDRATFANNLGGGLSVTGGTVVVRNSVFIDNGKASPGGTSFGALSISDPLDAAVVVEFNTLKDNDAAEDSPAGIACESTRDIAVRNNIVWGSLPLQAETTDAQCRYTYTLSNQTIPGETNLSGNPTFLPGDFHLAADSMGVDAAGPSDINVDIDGDPRPLPEGGRPDIGADEVRP